ncbi:MAG: hypothetical protein AB1898_22275 [Acidobacteriota bacterium]
MGSLIGCFAVSGSLAGQTPFALTPDVDRIIRSGLDHMYHLDLQAADRQFDELVRRFPDHPIGYMYKAELVWWQALRDKNNKKLQDRFDEYTDKAIDAGNALIKKSPGDFHGHLYLASAYGNRTRFKVTVTKSYFGAMRSGMKGNDQNQQACALRPNYVDCLIGIGAYNYFAGSLPAVIKPFAWMLGARGDREQGLKQLELAAAKGEYGQTEAKIVLLGVYYNEKRFDDYHRLLTALIDQYPSNHVFYMWLADFFINQQKLDEGIQYFSNLIKKGHSQGIKISLDYANREKSRLEEKRGTSQSMGSSPALKQAVS